MIPWLRPVNLRDAFIKDQKALAADISLKRSALQAVLDRDEDGGGTMVRSAIKSCWGSPRQNCCLLWFKCCLLEKMEDKPMQLAVFETITNHHPCLLMLFWICGSFSHSSGALFYQSYPMLHWQHPSRKIVPKPLQAHHHLNHLYKCAIEM